MKRGRVVVDGETLYETGSSQSSRRIWANKKGTQANLGAFSFGYGCLQVGPRTFLEALPIHLKPNLHNVSFRAVGHKEPPY